MSVGIGHAAATSLTLIIFGAVHTTFSMSQQLQLADFWGKKRRNTSMIWEHFGFVIDDKGVIVNRERVTCKYCNAELKYQGGTTSNLQYHYNLLHLKDAKPSVSVSSQPTIAQSMGNIKAYSTSSRRHSLLQKRVGEFLVENLVPFSTASSTPLCYLAPRKLPH